MSEENTEFTEERAKQILEDWLRIHGKDVSKLEYPDPQLNFEQAWVFRTNICVAKNVGTGVFVIYENGRVEEAALRDILRK